MMDVNTNFLGLTLSRDWRGPDQVAECEKQLLSFLNLIRPEFIERLEWQAALLREPRKVEFALVAILPESFVPEESVGVGRQLGFVKFVAAGYVVLTSKQKRRPKAIALLLESVLVILEKCYICVVAGDDMLDVKSIDGTTAGHKVLKGMTHLLVGFEVRVICVISPALSRHDAWRAAFAGPLQSRLQK
jgi:hypothetical protein